MRPHILPLVALLATALIPAPARAEVELSLAIKGSAEEIAAVLQFLQTAGLTGGGGVQVQVESSFTRPEVPAEPAPAPPPPPPTLGLTNPLISPTSARPGGATLLSVDVIDADRKVDTITATLGDNTLTADLYDNGMRGDVAAGDGRWSVLLNLPADLPDGAYTIQIQPYDAQGAVLNAPQPDGQSVPLTISTTVNISRG
jgi:hypothetical protein